MLSSGYVDNPYLNRGLTLKKLYAAREKLILDDASYSKNGLMLPASKTMLEQLWEAITMAEQHQNGRIKVSQKDERTYDGMTFASKAEMRRYVELKMLQSAGAIRNLECQPSFVLQDSFNHKTFGKVQKIVYRADFSYFDVSLGHIVVEDVKGYRTEVYKLKKKLFLSRYPDIDFREVGVGKQRRVRRVTWMIDMATAGDEYGSGR